MNGSKTEPGKRLLIVVPMYNEAANIPRVVDEIRRSLPAADIVVIDDGSTDDSAAIARKQRVAVIRLPYNLGIGGAVQTGYLYACQSDYDLVVRMDSDGQHDPAQVSQLIEPILQNQADVVIGSRGLSQNGYQASGLRAVGTKVFATVVSFVVRQRFTDTTSGFQALNREAAGFLANHLPVDYPEIEGLLLLCRAGFRVGEVPVTMRPRQAGDSSITFLKSIYYLVKVLLAILVELLRKPLRRGGVQWTVSS